MIRVEAMTRINCMDDLGDEIITVVSAVLTLKEYPQAHRKNQVQAAGERDVIMKRGLGVALAGMVILCVCVWQWKKWVPSDKSVVFVGLEV